jgi:hypothetical protein
MDDMLSKRRHSFGGRHATKLTEGDVRNIRELILSGQTQDEVATKFKVSRSMVGLIAQYERWSDTTHDQEFREKLTSRPARGSAETCKKGHSYADGGFYLSKAGSRLCKTCHRERVARYLENGGAEKKRAGARRA